MAQLKTAQDCLNLAVTLVGELRHEIDAVMLGSPSLTDQFYQVRVLLAEYTNESSRHARQDFITRSHQLAGAFEELKRKAESIRVSTSFAVGTLESPPH